MRSVVEFGGYPEYQHRRSKWNELELAEVGEEENASQARLQLENDLNQLRWLQQISLHLHRGEYKPQSAPQQHLASNVQFQRKDSRSLPMIRDINSLELRDLLKSVDWRELKEPFTFQAPSDMVPVYKSRQELITDSQASSGGEDFQTATVLSDALAAQFGPSMLGEDRYFAEAHKAENCFTQLNESSMKINSPPRKTWDAIPRWMRCSMVVISTGNGGNGVAFHKHGAAWLVLQQGVKRWWLYPPSGPPTQEAYDQVALCPAWKLPEVIAKLPQEARPIELTQRPGQGVYVPALWWHATLDEGPTLGVGSQYNMADLDIMQCHRDFPDSAFVLYHVACELHKTDEEQAVKLFEEAISREPLNFYFHTNQLLFYLNVVIHPEKTCTIIERLMRKITSVLDIRRQMIVQRFTVPTICNFAEWHAPHDRLVKYSARAVASAWDALMTLVGPMLPGGSKFHLSSDLPSLGNLEYVATCSQCSCIAKGKAGQPGSIRAHKFFCIACTRTREEAICGNCGRQGGDGQMGHPGTEFAREWFCCGCWSLWNHACRKGLSDADASRQVLASVPQTPEKFVVSSTKARGASLPEHAPEEIVWVAVD